MMNRQKKRLKPTQNQVIRAKDIMESGQINMWKIIVNFRQYPLYDRTHSKLSLLSPDLIIFLRNIKKMKGNGFSN